MNLSGLVGYTGGHVLGNFSVTKQRGEAGGGFTAKLKDLQDGIEPTRSSSSPAERSSPEAINSSCSPPRASGTMNATPAEPGS